MSGYKYLGDFSATPPWYSVSMSCDDCRVSWSGCWDNFECPKCGKGELPNNRIEDLDSILPERCKNQGQSPMTNTMRLNERFYPDAVKAHKKWIKNAADNPIIMANPSFESFLAGAQWQAAKQMGDAK